MVAFRADPAAGPRVHMTHYILADGQWDGAREMLNGRTLYPGMRLDNVFRTARPGTKPGQ